MCALYNKDGVLATIGEIYKNNGGKPLVTARVSLIHTGFRVDDNTDAICEKWFSVHIVKRPDSGAARFYEKWLVRSSSSPSSMTDDTLVSLSLSNRSIEHTDIRREPRGMVLHNAPSLYDIPIAMQLLKEHEWGASNGMQVSAVSECGDGSCVYEQNNVRDKTIAAHPILHATNVIASFFFVENEPRQ